MRTAVTVFMGKVAPVLEEARHLLVSGPEPGHHMLLHLDRPGLAGQPEALKAFGIEVLLCGAACRETESCLVQAGVRVVSFIGGDAKEVLEASEQGRLDPAAHPLPGCGCGRRRRGARRVEA